MVKKCESEELTHMFRPQVGRAPTDAHKHTTTTVYDHLYNYKDIYKTKKDNNREIQYSKMGKYQNKITNNSDSILESSLYDKFTKLFNLIDQNETG